MPGHDNNDYGKITVDGTDPDQIPVAKGGSLSIYNLGASTIYLGDSSVTTATGFPILANTGYSLDVDSGNSWYIIGAAGLDVRYMVY